MRKRQNEGSVTTLLSGNTVPRCFQLAHNKRSPAHKGAGTHTDEKRMRVQGRGHPSQQEGSYRDPTKPNLAVSVSYPIPGKQHYYLHCHNTPAPQQMDLNANYDKVRVKNRKTLMGTPLTPNKAGIKTYYSTAQHKELGTILSLALMFFMSNLQDRSNNNQHISRCFGQFNKFRKVKDTGLYKWLTSSTTA